jgi:hypothetical protein
MKGSSGLLRIRSWVYCKTDTQLHIFAKLYSVPLIWNWLQDLYWGTPLSVYCFISLKLLLACVEKTTAPFAKWITMCFINTSILVNRRASRINKNVGNRKSDNLREMWRWSHGTCDTFPSSLASVTFEQYTVCLIQARVTYIHKILLASYGCHHENEACFKHPYTIQNIQLTLFEKKKMCPKIQYLWVEKITFEYYPEDKWSRSSYDNKTSRLALCISTTPWRWR